jgi:transcriptional regulator with XRE-family HTH domain
MIHGRTQNRGLMLKSDSARPARLKAADERAGPRAAGLALRLAEQVRHMRIHAGLTQAELAARAGVTVETVARLERVLRGRVSANANPSLETMERIGGALGVEVSDLLSAPSKSRRRDDGMTTILRGVSSATRRRVLRVAEALVREERAEARPMQRRR